LYGQIVSFDNLMAAAYRARRGKRLRPDVAAFHFHVEANVLALQKELTDKTYVPGPYRAFFILDPKRRLISAAPYRDRVVHHAVCQVVEPLFERSFIYDSYANRCGKGTHRAVERCTFFCRRHRYVLKCDIEKYFPSIDHAILMSHLARKIKCADTLWLLAQIIGHANPQEEVIRYYPGDTLFTPFERRRGIPIGNLTSQFFANVYLNGLDHFVLERLRPGGYVRFVDDFLLFADDKGFLHRALAVVRGYLQSLRLSLHPHKCQVYPVRCGVEFLGWQVYPDHRRLRRRSGVRMQRRLRRLRQQYARGEKSLAEVRASVMSCLGHLQHGDTWGLRRALLGQLTLRRGGRQ